MIKRAIGVTTLTIVLLAGASVAQASLRLVAPTGANTGSCLASACHTIQYAIGQAGGGDTIAIAAGTYPETLTVTKDLTFTGVGPQTFIDANAAASPGVAMDISDQHVTLQNLRIRGGLTPGGGGTENPAIDTLAPLPSALTIIGCTVEQAPASSPALQGSAVEFSAATTLTIASSTITGFEGAIGTQAGSTVAIASSTIGVPLTSTAGTNSAIGLNDSPTTITDSTVTGDEAIDDDNGDLTLTRSVVHGRKLGVFLRDDFGGPHVTLRDSIVAPGNGELDTAVAINGTGASQTLRPVLTLVGDSILARSDTGAIGIDTTLAKADTTVFSRNTILRAIDPGSGTDQADIATGATNPIRWDLGYTAFTTISGPAIPIPGSDTNIAAAPHFLDDTGGNLQLDTTSALFDAGDPVQVTDGETDITGHPRAVSHNCFSNTAIPDIGAYEATPLCIVPPGGPPPVAQPPATTDATPPPAPPAPPATPAAKDTTRPVLSKLSFHSSHFTVAHHSKLHVTLSETADVKVSVQVPHHHSHHRPTTYVTIGSVTYHHESHGFDSITFSGRIHSKALHHGSYRAVIYATDAAGNVSSHHHLNFAIVSH